jgi:hypothetical protein
MKLAKGASFRFTPITDQRYATLLTLVRHRQRSRIAAQQLPEHALRDHLIFSSGHRDEAVE